MSYQSGKWLQNTIIIIIIKTAIKQETHLNLVVYKELLNSSPDLLFLCAWKNEGVPVLSSLKELSRSDK